MDAVCVLGFLLLLHRGMASEVSHSNNINFSIRLRYGIQEVHKLCCVVNCTRGMLLFFHQKFIRREIQLLPLHP
jgi:hypothetical protein